MTDLKDFKCYGYERKEYCFLKDIEAEGLILRHKKSGARIILISNDEGLTWTKADTAKNQLPAVYQARQKQNAIVRDNNIYLFGGQDTETTHSDVYKGRLNSIDWK